MQENSGRVCGNSCRLALTVSDHGGKRQLMLMQPGQIRWLPPEQQFPLMPRKSYVTMGANSSLNIATIRLGLWIGVS